MSEQSLPQIQPIINPQVRDLTGQRFGRLLVLGYAGAVKKKARWLCQCDCGQTKIINRSSLLSGGTQSCGCLHNELVSQQSTTHGLSHRVPEYGAWSGMLTRCTNPNVAAFSDYGERGIKVCERWRRFENFYADMGPKPAPEYSLDRIDVNGDYEPANCRWATPLEQANNARSNIPLTHDGKTMNLTEWARELGLKKITLYDRINKLGWSVERALTTPTRKMTRRQ